MVIKVFLSGISASKEVKKRQQRALIILDSCKVDYESIDITEPGMEDTREFMQQNSKIRAPNKTPIAPQFFNDEVYCGDYEDFDSAVEVNQVLQFLKLEAAINEEPEEIQNTTNGVIVDNEQKDKGLPTKEEEDAGENEKEEGEGITDKNQHEEAEEEEEGAVDFWGESQDDNSKKRKKKRGDSETAEESPTVEVEEDSWSGQGDGHKRLKMQDEEKEEGEDEERDFWGEETSEEKTVENVKDNDDEEEEEEEEGD